MHTRAVQYGMPWVTGGMMYSIGRGAMALGFCNQTFLQYGCKKGIYLIPGMYAGLLLQIWKNLVGVWQSCILGKLG